MKSIAFAIPKELRIEVVAYKIWNTHLTYMRVVSAATKIVVWTLEKNKVFLLVIVSLVQLRLRFAGHG